MFDVIAVHRVTRKVRMLGENKTERDADSIEMMAIMRIGGGEEFFERTPAGLYSEGAVYQEGLS